MELLKVLAKQGNLVPLVEKVRRSYLLLPAWYHVSSNSLRTRHPWSGQPEVPSAVCVRWGCEETESVLFLCVSLGYHYCARSIMKRSRRSCCERTLVRALPPSLPPPPPPPVHRIIAYFPNSEWRSHHRKFTAQPFQFTPKIGLVHCLHLWNPLHVK